MQLHIHPDDVRWLRRWLRNNLACFGLITVVLIGIRWTHLDAAPLHEESVQRHEPVMSQAKRAARAPAVVRPEGWRRTRHGWQHTNWWLLVDEPTSPAHAARESIDESPSQQATTPSPIVIVLTQILAVATVIGLSRKGKADDRSLSTAYTPASV